MGQINGVAEDIVLKSDLVNFIYPVGSYYWSSANTNPSELFGGEWERIKDRFILAAGDSYTAGDIGGEAAHTLTVDEMPSHSHGLEYSTDGKTWNSTIDNVIGRDGNITAENYLSVSNSVEMFDRWKTRIAESGNSIPHNNMPPYEVAYCWKRIA